MTGFVLLLVSLTGVFALDKPVWRGKRAVENGVEVISNPKKPLYLEPIVRFTEDLRVATGKAPYEGISTIQGIEVDDAGSMYILDSKENCVHVLDRDGKPVKAIGRQGQGPGEFQEPQSIYFTPNGEIFIWDKTRISVFSKDWKFLHGHPSSILDEIDQCAVDRDGNIFGTRMMLWKKPYTYEASRFGLDFRPEKTIETYTLPTSADGLFDLVAPRRMNLCMTKDGLLLIATQDRYEMRLCDASGNVKRRILREHDGVPVTKKFKEEMLRGAPEDFARRQKFSDHYPAWKQIFTGAGDHIFVETYERTDDETKNVFDIFDGSGRFVARTPIARGWVRLIKGDHVYMLETDEEGFYILKRLRITWEDSYRLR